jgi:hypothetical protein
MLYYVTQFVELIAISANILVKMVVALVYFSLQVTISLLSFRLDVLY